MRGEGAHEIAAARLEALAGRRIEPRRALELARDIRVVGRRDIAAVGLGPHVAQEREEALPHPGRLELVAENGVSDSVMRPGAASRTSSSGR